jgi:drug/metabolite transporter (DMT)-like permease
MPYVIFIFIAAVWGSSFILMKKAGLCFDPIVIGAGRVTFGALILAVIWLSGKREWPMKREHLLPLSLVALFGYGYPFCLQPYLINRCGSAFIGMMVCFVPLLTILISIPMLGIRPSRRQFLGVMGGLLFISLLLAEGWRRNVSVTDLLLAVSVPTVYATCNTFIKRRFVGVPSLVLAGSALGLAALFLIPASFLLPGESTYSGPDFPLAASCLAVLGFIGTGIVVVLFYNLIQNQGPLFAGMVAYVIPLGAIAWGWADDETVTLVQLCAILGVLAMVAVVQWDLVRKNECKSDKQMNG